MSTSDGRGTDDRHRECRCGGALLTEFFVWTVIATLLLSVVIAVTYLALDFCSPAPPPPPPPPRQHRHKAVTIGSALQAPKRAIVNVTTREYCSTVSKDLYSLEQLGYVDADRRVSRLLGLQDVGADDVHYVLANDTHVPLLFTCSLESVLRTVQGNRSRVNVFVVFGIEFGRPVLDEQLPVPLSSSLASLRATYGGNRLNVVHIDLKECLDCSPFQGMDLGKSPGFAKFAVQLVLLWQFGGTVLDDCAVAVRGLVYRATGKAVRYGGRTVSAPVPCHEFVYDVMSCAKSYALRYRTFGPDTARRIVAKTVARRGGRAAHARPVADGVVCRGGVISGHCYYVEADRAVSDPDSYVYSFCPVVGGSPVLRHRGKHLDDEHGGLDTHADGAPYS